MKRIIISVVILYVVKGSILQNKDHNMRDPHCYHHKEDFSYQVAILSSDKPNVILCAGALISNSHILAPASCVDNHYGVVAIFGWTSPDSKLRRHIGPEDMEFYPTWPKGHHSKISKLPKLISRYETTSGLTQNEDPFDWRIESNEKKFRYAGKQLPYYQNIEKHHNSESDCMYDCRKICNNDNHHLHTSCDCTIEHESFDWDVPRPKSERNRDADSERNQYADSERNHYAFNKRNQYTDNGWNQYDDNIAILKLQNPVELTENIQLISLPNCRESSADINSQNIIVSGWTDFGPIYPALPYIVPLSVARCDQQELPNRACFSSIEDERTDLDKTGGLLVAQSLNGNTKVLTGLSDVTNNHKTLKVFIKISPYVEWILSNIGIFNH